MWTTVPPAKSKQGIVPPEEGVEQAALAPHHVRHREVDDEHPETVKSSMALNFMRSAKAPEMSAGVMIANINW